MAVWSVVAPPLCLLACRSEVTAFSRVIILNCLWVSFSSYCRHLYCKSHTRCVTSICQLKPSFFSLSLTCSSLSLHTFPAVIYHRQDVLEGSNLRAPLQELHQMIMTPIKAFSGGEEASLQRPLLSPEGKSVAPGSHLSGSGGGEAESGTSVIAEGDLPSQFTRVMGKGELHAPVLRDVFVLF